MPLIEIPECGRPGLGLCLRLLEKTGQLVSTLVDLGQCGLMQGGQAVLGGKLISPSPIRGKATLRPCLAQNPVDELGLVRALGARRAQQDLVEKHLRAAQGHIGAVIGKHHPVVRAGETTVARESLQELEGVPHLLGPAHLGIAAVGRPVGGRREVAAGRA